MTVVSVITEIYEISVISALKDTTDITSNIVASELLGLIVTSGAGNVRL